ncbi:MAG: lipopolysaccharide biosynthesis protein [Armatimonadota bacterium]|nr:lipopolysaccharide biosynthesis protein [Armatimonadota bacterium]
MSLTRETLKHTAVYAGANVALKLAGLILLPVYSRLFDTEGYGILGMLEASLGLLGILLTYGFQNAVLWLYHDVEPHRRDAVYVTAVGLMAVTGMALVAIPLLFSSSLSGLLLGDSRYASLIALSLVTLVVDVTAQSAATYHIIHQRSTFYSALSLLSLALSLGLNILFIIVWRFGLVGFCLSSLFVALVRCALFTASALRRTRLQFDLSMAWLLFRFQAPLIPAEFLAFVSRQSERFLVRYLISLDGVGILEMAYKFPPLLNYFFGSPFLLTWRATTVRVAEQADGPRVIGGMLTGYAFGMLFLGLLMAVNLGPLITLLTPPSFWPSVRIAKVEVLNTLLSAGIGYVQFGLLYRHRTRRLAAIKTAGAIAKLVLSAVLIGLFGLAGAAYASLCVYACMLAWVGHDAQRVYRLDIEWSRLAVLAATALGVYLLIDALMRWPAGPVPRVGEIVGPMIHGLAGAWPVEGTRVGRWLTFLVWEREKLGALIVNTAVALSYGAVLFWVRPQLARHLVSRGAGALAEWAALRRRSPSV